MSVHTLATIGMSLPVRKSGAEVEGKAAEDEDIDEKEFSIAQLRGIMNSLTTESRWLFTSG